MQTLQIPIKKLDARAVMPSYGSEYAAGADLCALLDNPAEIQPGQTLFIPTGLAVEIPEGFVGLICARSGLSCKHGVAPANKIGVIDSDYRGELQAAPVQPFPGNIYHTARGANCAAAHHSLRKSKFYHH